MINIDHNYAESLDRVCCIETVSSLTSLKISAEIIQETDLL